MPTRTNDSDIKEMLLKLLPVLGRKDIEQLWLTYCVSDEKEKAEISQRLKLMLVQNLDQGIANQTSLFLPPSELGAAGKYRVGNVIYGDKTLYPFGLEDKEICEHISICGRTGAAKTTVLFHILLEMMKKNPDVKILAFDWKRELRSLLNEPSLAGNVRVYTVGRDNVSGISFNPLIPPPGAIITNHLENLLDIICRCFYAGEGVYDILTRAIDECYREFKVYEGKAKRYPTFLDVHNKIQSYNLKGRENEWKSSALRITRALGFGEFGKIVNIPQQYPLEELFNQHVILEMDVLPMAKRVFFVSSLLLWLYNHALSKRSNEQNYDQNLNRIVVIEEAHNIATKHVTSTRESVVEMLIRQARFLGLGLILIDQPPSQLSPVVLANTHVHINLNQKNGPDINTASSNLLLDDNQKRWLSQLKVGEAIIRLSGRYLLPFVIRVDPVKIKEKIVTDEVVSEHMKLLQLSYSNDSAYETVNNGSNGVIRNGAKYKDKLTEKETLLLKDIIEHPFIGIAERYKRLGITAEQGNKAKEDLFKKGVVDAEKVNTGKSQILLLRLTKVGEEIANELGFSITRIDGQASLEHEYWRNRVAQYCRNFGYQVKFEVRINGDSDIVAEKGDLRIALEIETGKNGVNDAIDNIQKNLKAGGFEQIISVATNKEFFGELQNKVKETGLGPNDQVKVVLSDKF